MRADGFCMTVASVSRRLLLVPSSGPQLTSPSGTWYSQTGQSKVTRDKALTFAQPLLIIPSVHLAKTSLFQGGCRSAWIGMIAPTVVHGRIAVMNTYATDVSTAPKSKTSTIKRPNV